MLSNHGVGNPNFRGALSRMPRATVGIVLGPVLVLAQGQSEASPFYQVGIACNGRRNQCVMTTWTAIER